MTVLRTRSGESRPPEAPVDQAALAEMGQVVADARAEINRLVQLGELQDDPIRHPIEALSVHLDALYKVTLAGSQTLAKQIQTSDAFKPSVQDDVLRRAVTQGVAAHAGRLVRTLNYRTMLMLAGMLVAGVLAGISIGRYVLPQPPQMMVSNCTPLPLASGGEAWSCSFWTRPPTPGQR